ncbi:MAG: hypothetical protein JNM07_02780 [Phycisphaerae bacterium]|nr:hypothetical protein [Phycisphaerae bacterium]
MTLPNDAIRVLGGASPAAVRPGQSEHAPAHAADFGELLRRAENGGLVTRHTVTVPSELKLGLDQHQISRLGAAIDRAEVSGLKSPLVLIDGKALVVDVPTRTVTRSLDLELGAIGVDGIDGVVPVEAPDAKGHPLAAHSFGVPSNGSLVDLLARRTA